jgi:protein-disulfide isomerase
MRINRRRVVFVAAAAALAACGSKSGAATTEDMALGPADAKVTVIEYASLMCSHCREFHDTIWPELKKNYVDTGKIRFVLRELPTGPRNFAIASFQIARCASGGDSQAYFQAVDAFFHQQPQIFEAAQGGQGRAKLLEIAKGLGMSEDAFNQCIQDPAGGERVAASEKRAADEFKVTGTPTLILNGELIPQTPENPYTYARVAAAIEAALK